MKVEIDDKLVEKLIRAGVEEAGYDPPESEEDIKELIEYVIEWYIRECYGEKWLYDS